MIKQLYLFIFVWNKQVTWCEMDTCIWSLKGETFSCAALMRLWIRDCVLIGINYAEKNCEHYAIRAIFC